MINNNKISVIIPAFNEEKLIAKTINTMPEEADYLIVINDKSKDGTLEIVEQLASNNKKIILINHEKNYGVGKALKTGYKKSIELDSDISVVMPGDAQALPEDFLKIVKPFSPKSFKSLVMFLFIQIFKCFNFTF